MVGLPGPALAAAAAYLVTMWILGSELRTLYAPWTGNDAAALMTSTMELVRAAAVCGESAGLSRRGLDLARAWRPVTAAARGRLVDNVVGHLLNGVSEPVLVRAFEYWHNVDKGIGDKIEQGVRAKQGDKDPKAAEQGSMARSSMQAKA